MSSQLFGSNTKLIDDYMRHMESFPWFTRIETPHADDTRLVRVRMDFILDHPDDPWSGAAVDAETQIDRHIIDSSRLSEQYSLQRAFRAPWNNAHVDAILEELLERYQDYYPGTCSYAHEFLDLPERTIRYAFYECLVDDLTPRVTFFRDLVPWFEQGYWPCGWRGKFPGGQLILL
jgi:hypothetical protein